MNKSKASIPESWREIKLAETGKIFSGGTPDTKILKYWNGHIAWCTPTDITSLNGKKYITTTSRFITKEGLNNSSATLLPENSLVICTRATIGDCAINKTPISTNQGFKCIVPSDNMSIEFLYYIINQIKPTLIKLSSGSTFLEISKKAFESIQILLPPFQEQKKIAEILSTIDEKIEIIDVKVAQTQELKKGLMQQLLLKGIGHTKFKSSILGEIPESWNVVNAIEVFELIHGYQFRDYDFTPEGVKVLKIGQIKANGKIDLKNCSFISSDRFEEFKGNIIFNGDVLMALTGATLGKSCLVSGLSEPVLQNYRVGKFEPVNENLISKEYLFFLLGSKIVLDQIFAKVNSGAQGNIGKADFVKLKIPLPNIEEQHKIASLLKIIDSKLEVLNEKKDNCVSLKRGLMQQLLTGKIRVNSLIDKEVLA